MHVCLCVCILQKAFRAVLRGAEVDQTWTGYECVFVCVWQRRRNEKNRCGEIIAHGSDSSLNDLSTHKEWHWYQNACFKTDRPIQCHPLPTQMGQVRVMAMMMMMSIQEDRVLYRYGCSQRALRASWSRAGRTDIFSRYARMCYHVSKSGFRRSHGSLLHIFCPCLSLVVGLDWGEWGWWWW